MNPSLTPPWGLSQLKDVTKNKQKKIGLRGWNKLSKNRSKQNKSRMGCSQFWGVHWQSRVTYYCLFCVLLSFAILHDMGHLNWTSIFMIENNFSCITGIKSNSWMSARFRWLVLWIFTYLAVRLWAGPTPPESPGHRFPCWLWPLLVHTPQPTHLCLLRVKSREDIIKQETHIDVGKWCFEKKIYVSQ